MSRVSSTPPRGSPERAYPVAGQVYLLGGLSRILGTHGDDQILQRPEVLRISRPFTTWRSPLHAVSVRGIHQRPSRSRPKAPARVKKRESPAAGRKSRFPDGQVRMSPWSAGSLGMYRIDRCYGHPRPISLGFTPPTSSFGRAAPTSADREVLKLTLFFLYPWCLRWRCYARARPCGPGGSAGPNAGIQRPHHNAASLFDDLRDRSRS